MLNLYRNLVCGYALVMSMAAYASPTLSTAVTSPTSLPSVPVTVTYPNPKNLVTNFSIAGSPSIQLSNAAIDKSVPLQEISPNVYTFNVNPLSAGTFSVEIPGGFVRSNGHKTSKSNLLSLVYSGVADSCPDDDGSSQASAGSPQYPELLAGYAAAINGPHGLGCKVAGVDYHVGFTQGLSLKDPTAGGLPLGCSFSGQTVSCSGDDITVQGWDFSVRGGLMLQMSGSNIVVTQNNFVVGSNCLEPIAVTSSGSASILYNTIDGAGPLCSSFTNGTNGLINYIGTADGARITIEWNWIKNIPEDAIDYRGPNFGAAQIIEKFNLKDLQGWIGHPDGIQLNGGNFSNSVLSHETYRNQVRAGSFAGVQPFHIEAQLTAVITDFTVSYNTIVTPGTCSGGKNYPVGCSVNYDVACKQDTSPGTNTNVGFSAYANYSDSTGAIAAFLGDNFGNCQNTSYGIPYMNFDMVQGIAD